MKNIHPILIGMRPVGGSTMSIGRVILLNGFYRITVESCSCSALSATPVSGGAGRN